MSSDLRVQVQASLGDTFVLERELAGGGMSHVFVARDRSLDRRVVVKVLPPHAAASVSAERFKREIALVARLQHPHIVPLISAGVTADGLPFYTMPLVEGESLGARLARERELAIPEAVAVLRDVARALAYAHDHGVVHRDIKPGNVLLSGDSAMVTDFGVARAMAVAGSDDSPKFETITQHGTSLGTPAYMSPEQAAAEETVDTRADLYAFGCMAYEMLAGEPPFAGRTTQAVLFAHMVEIPEAIDRRRPSVPPPLAALVMQCLEKRPADRPKSAGDVQRTLESLVGVSGVPSSVRGVRRPVAWMPWAAFAAALAVGVWALVHRAGKSSAQPVTRFVVAGVSDPALNGAPTITPDGSRLVYVDVSDPNHSIYVRALDSLRSRVLPGTEGAVAPFISPDGKWIGFFTGNQLKKVLLDGSTPSVVLSAAPAVARGSWSSKGIIVFSGMQAGALSWVAATGGAVHTLTTIDSSSGETTHGFPFVLPGGTSVAFTLFGRPSDNQIAVASLDPSATHPAPHVKLGVSGRVMGMRDGWLLLLRGELTAVRYDASRQRVSGDPVPVLQEPGGDIASASLGEDGTLLYTHGEGSTVVLVDTLGIARPLFDERSMPRAGIGRTLMNPRISPDGKRLEVQVTSSPFPGKVTQDVWLYDIASGTPTRLTSAGEAFGAEWAPDGRRLIYSTNNGAVSTVWSLAADGGSPPEKLLEVSGPVWCTLTPDGRTLVFERLINKVWSLWSMRLDTAARLPVPWLREAFNDYMPHVSPDGHWLAYVSGANEREEVFVRSFPGPGAPVQVSEGGGTEPMWALDGHRLFYRQGRALVAASAATSSGFGVTSRRVLFQGAFDGGMPHANYAVRDGRHFVMITAGRVTTDAVVVRNWGEEMAAKVGRAR